MLAWCPCIFVHLACYTCSFGLLSIYIGAPCSMHHLSFGFFVFSWINEVELFIYGVSKSCRFQWMGGFVIPSITPIEFLDLYGEGVRIWKSNDFRIYNSLWWEKFGVLVDVIQPKFRYVCDVCALFFGNRDVSYVCKCFQYYLL